MYGSYVGYIFVIIGTLITLCAQIYLNSKYNKYKSVRSNNNLSGMEVARKILDHNGLQDIYVTEVKGTLTDHYDPSRRVVRLSSSVFHDSSIASVSVAAHEVGHAIQHKEGYIFIKMRSFMVPLVNFSSRFGYISVMIGLIFGMINLAWFGLILLLAILLFQLITLPTEFDASKRGIEQLVELNIIEDNEESDCRSMLFAAALTYVAGLAATILQLLRLFLDISSRDR